MREMTIEAIRVSLMNYHRVVVLKEKDSNRFLPIWIGAPEADAIAVRQQGVSVPRPMTHDLLSSVISQPLRTQRLHQNEVVTVPGHFLDR